MARKIAVSSRVVSEYLDEEAVLLDLKAKTYYGLNPVATRIWTLLQEGSSEAAILSTLSSEYEVSRSCLEKDLPKFLKDLKKNELLVQKK